MNDKLLISYILKAKDISTNTKEIYIKKLKFIQKNIMKKSLIYILKHPKEFSKNLNYFISHTKGKFYKHISLHTKAGIISSVMSLFIKNPTLKSTYPNLYTKWFKYDENERIKLINSKQQILSNKKSYISKQNLETIRDNLKVKSQERNLLNLYLEFPNIKQPHIIKISSQHQPTNNYIIMKKQKAYLITDDNKTKLSDKFFKDIPTEQSHLFISPKTNKEYHKEDAFKKWANKTLKKITKDKNYNLTILNQIHKYINSKDMKTNYVWIPMKKDKI